MASKRKNVVSPLLTAKGSALTDWPAEKGRSGRILAQVMELQKRRRKKKAAVAACLIAVLAGVGWFVPYFKQTGTEVAATGEIRMLRLADGSDADLNANTEVHRDFRFGRREIELTRGEAYFKVAPDSRHPFLVKTLAGVIQVSGTEFNVRIDSAGNTEVTLFQGGVSFVRAGGMIDQLHPGQQTTSVSDGIKTLLAPELEAVTAWRKGKFAFDGLSLTQVAERLGVFHGKKITVSSAVAQLEATGKMEANDLPGIFLALETALKIRVISLPDGSYRIDSK